MVGETLNEEMDENDRRELPKHRRCAAQCAWLEPAAKAHAMWNCQNSRPLAANLIKEAVGKKLQTPGLMHWNSYYDSCAGLFEVLEEPEKKDELNVVLSAFYEGDKDMLAQYCKIMKPVAICLDILQSGDNAYMDILLPNLKLMKVQVAASSLED
ncbi:hypothetical protein Pmani_006485 [Petrolisthes manimaculis]|uniref:Uncharacterized protein n=1 Tax=Petrolisthes manimaculis TaxID=1843537 RepID=A0AAE1UL41_9EUCA|nr:hypothetical protein Pmani_006485 [Petrolisthes manimaculis]